MVLYVIWAWTVICDTSVFYHPITLTGRWWGRRWMEYIQNSTCLVIECSRTFSVLYRLVSGWRMISSYLSIGVYRSTLLRLVWTVLWISFGTCTWWRRASDIIWLLSLRWITWRTFINQISAQHNNLVRFFCKVLFASLLFSVRICA